VSGLIFSSCDKDDEIEPDKKPTPTDTNDDTNEEPTFSVGKEDLVGEWRTSASNYWYLKLNIDMTAESGQYSSAMQDFSEIENGDWELQKIEITEINMETGEMTDKTVDGIVFEIGEYYYEYEVIKDGDVITLKDHDNNKTYSLHEQYVIPYITKNEMDDLFFHRAHFMRPDSDGPYYRLSVTDMKWEYTIGTGDESDAFKLKGSWDIETDAEFGSETAEAVAILTIEEVDESLADNYTVGGEMKFKIIVEEEVSGGIKIVKEGSSTYYYNQEAGDAL
jgi:hypothetical protein